jgi:SAM-dependent methyltransferase
MNSDFPEAVPPAPDDWFEEWFNTDFYRKIYSHRDLEEAEACIDLILRSVELPRGVEAPTALDLACGPGRHAIAMAWRGLDVTAVDLAENLLAHARSEAARANVTVEFLRYDMREIPFVDRFDLAVQLFTSFGYFETDEEDLRVLGNVRRALHPGGYYALDLINAESLRRTLVPRSERDLEGVRIVEEREIAGRRVIKRITIESENQQRHFMESVRLYSPEEIAHLLVTAGFTPVQWFGDYYGAEFDAENSKRMLVISR